MDEDILKRIEIQIVGLSHRFKAIEKPILFIKNFLIFILKYKDLFTKAVFILLALWYLEYYKNSILTEVREITKEQADRVVQKIRYSIKKGK